MMRVTLLCLALVACGKAETHETVSTSSAAPSVAAPAPSIEAKPWFEGGWQGAFPIEKHQIALEPKLGGLKEWEKDDGKTTAGTVNVTITISPEGVAQGQATGALGDLSGAGAVEDDKLTVQWASKDGKDYFSGVLSAARDGSRLSGTFQGSTGDSLTVRSARVTLDKSK